MRVFRAASVTKEVFKAWVEICLNTNIYWIKHNTSYATLFANHRNAIEPRWSFLKQKDLLQVLLKKLKEVAVSLLPKVFQPVVLESFIRKLIK